MKITPDVIYDTWKRGREIAYNVKDICEHRLSHYGRVYSLLRDLEEEEGFVEHQENADDTGTY